MYRGIEIWIHYNDVILASWCLKSPAPRPFVPNIVQANNNDKINKIKICHSLPFVCVHVCVCVWVSVRWWWWWSWCTAPRRASNSESVSIPWCHNALPTSQCRSIRFNDACVYAMYYGAYLCNRNEAFGADERSRLIMISEGHTLLVSYYPFISQRLSLPSGASRWNWNGLGLLKQKSDHHDSVLLDIFSRDPTEI